MMATSKSRLCGLLMLLFVSNAALSQWSDGPFLSVGGQAAIPTNPELKRFSWAAGGFGKFALPLGSKDYCTLSMNAISINGAWNGKNLKERDVLSGMIGYRYDFRTEEKYSYFFMEPQIGWSFVGTDYNSFSYMPAVGYSLNGKLDFLAWYHTTTSGLRLAKISIAGVAVCYNFHFARKAE